MIIDYRSGDKKDECDLNRLYKGTKIEITQSGIEEE